MVFASMAPRDFDNQDRQKYPASGKARSNSIDSCDSNEPETIDDEPSPPIVEDAVSTSAPIQSQMHYAETDSSPLKRSREEVSGPFTIESIEMNKQYDVLDSTNRWCEAEVIKLDREGRRAYVTYIYWSSKYDEWITDIEGRFAALHAHTYHEGGVLKVGQRIEVKDEQNKWLESYVIEENENQVISSLHACMHIMCPYTYTSFHQTHNVHRLRYISKVFIKSLIRGLIALIEKGFVHMVVTISLFKERKMLYNGVPVHICCQWIQAVQHNILLNWSIVIHLTTKKILHH